MPVARGTSPTRPRAARRRPSGRHAAAVRGPVDRGDQRLRHRAHGRHEVRHELHRADRDARHRQAVDARRCAVVPRSRPAQKPRPAPVRTVTHVSLSAATARSASKSGTTVSKTSRSCARTVHRDQAHVRAGLLDEDVGHVSSGSCLGLASAAPTGDDVAVPPDGLPALDEPVTLTDGRRRATAGGFCGRARTRDAGRGRVLRPAIVAAAQRLNRETRPFRRARHVRTRLPSDAEPLAARRRRAALRLRAPLSRVAAELMRVAGCGSTTTRRCSGAAHGGLTPWHQDQVYWPLATTHTITMWDAACRPRRDIRASCTSLAGLARGRRAHRPADRARVAGRAVAGS